MTVNQIYLDESLITIFRNKVNEKPIFRSIFKNINNKNMWNVICSAMDWITVTTEGLPQIKLNYKSGFGANHIESLNLMQYIVSIDILVEAIIQLYRALSIGHGLQMGMNLKKSITILKISRIRWEECTLMNLLVTEHFPVILLIQTSTRSD